MKRILFVSLLLLTITGCTSGGSAPVVQPKPDVSTKYPNATKVTIEEADTKRDELVGKTIMFEGLATNKSPYQIGQQRKFGYIEFPECLGTSCNVSTWIGNIELRDMLICRSDGQGNATECQYPLGATLRIVGSWEKQQSGTSIIYMFKTLEYQVL